MIDKEVYKYGKKILKSKNMISTKNYIQHGQTSVFEHSVSVATMAVKISKKFKHIDTKSLVRGALLHDYFLYDWHEKDKSHRLHGFHHAKKALDNATKEYKLNKIERNMIYTHMFPMNLRIPKYKESIILCIADKICATKETIGVINRLEIIDEEI